MSCLSDGADILSLFLDAPEVFDDEAVIDEVIDFFFAGSMTIQFATQMLIVHFATDP